MFDFKRKVKVWSRCNTDINYLETKESLLNELKGLKERINECICELDENFKYQYMNLNNLLNAPFTPFDINNYNNEINEHFKTLRILEDRFEQLFINTIDTLLGSNDYRATTLKARIATENIKINECKNKYSEASNITLIQTGKDVILAQKQIEDAVAIFESSMEYLEVLQRYRIENMIRR